MKNTFVLLFLCEEPDGATALRAAHQTDQRRADGSMLFVRLRPLLRRRLRLFWLHNDLFGLWLRLWRHDESKHLRDLFAAEFVEEELSDGAVCCLGNLPQGADGGVAREHARERALLHFHLLCDVLDLKSVVLYYAFNIHI